MNVLLRDFDGILYIFLDNAQYPNVASPFGGSEPFCEHLNNLDFLILKLHFLK